MSERRHAGAREHLARMVGRAARPIFGREGDLDPLMEAIGDARFVLVGEATHGTEEFYRLRAALTRRLIVEKGFCAVAAEADWPDAWRANAYVRGVGPPIRDAADALSGFRRFPAWMWRNHAVADFLDWLREHNRRLPEAARAGFYGLDIYSLGASMEAVIGYLDRVDPEAAARARRHYGCLDHGLSGDGQAYGRAVVLGLRADCEDEVIAALEDLRARRHAHLEHDGLAADEAAFSAERNAVVVENAENYWRTMFSGRVSSWNLRDRHMTDTLAALDAHLSALAGRPARIVVWAHNSHVGDARATEMGEAGEVNVGSLARERWGGEAFLVGQTTARGTVTAAANWGEAGETFTVREALAESVEGVFADAEPAAFLLFPGETAALSSHLSPSRLERAIGVVYRPETERMSHYFFVRLPDQFDAVLHLDETRALEPLDGPRQPAPPRVPRAFDRPPRG